MSARLRSGFTMIELLVATLLVSIITIVSVTGFNTITNGWQTATDYLDKMQRTDYAINQIVSGLRSMYYPHDGKVDGRYGFSDPLDKDGSNPRNSDIIEWSKTGPAIVGTKNAIADTVHRVQVMVLEEGNTDYREPIQKTGLYARLCGDAALIPEEEGDETDYSFNNEELYQPLLIADGVVGFRCRTIKKAEDLGDGGGSKGNENDKDKFEDIFTESNSVPYKVELTFMMEKPDEELFSRSERAPLVRIISIPIHEQSLDGEAPPADGGKERTRGGPGGRRK